MTGGVKILDLPLADPIQGNEALVVVQSGVTKRAPASAFAGGESRQEVFIGQQPAINYPAISYSLIPGTNLYRQSVNVV